MPTIADFASMMMQGIRRAGDRTEMQFDSVGARIIKIEGGDDRMVRHPTNAAGPDHVACGLRRPGFRRGHSRSAELRRLK
jgi:hypothetical protein